MSKSKGLFNTYKIQDTAISNNKHATKYLSNVSYIKFILGVDRKKNCKYTKSENIHMYNKDEEKSQVCVQCRNRLRLRESVLKSTCKKLDGKEDVIKFKVIFNF